MSAKMTPGPWTVQTGHDWSNVHAANGVNVAHCGSTKIETASGPYYTTSAEALANATAIAALPDCIAALRDIVRNYDEFNDIDSIRIAVARAALTRAGVTE